MAPLGGKMARTVASALALATTAAALFPTAAHAAPGTSPLTAAPIAITKAPEMTYQVKKGDSFWAIAHRTGVSMYDLASANGLSIKDVIHPGQRLRIPSTRANIATKVAPVVKKTTTPVPAKTASVAKKTPTKTAVPASAHYTIRPGDTLSAIARSHGTTVAALASLNKITNPSRIYAGQRIMLSASASSHTPARTAPKPSKASTSRSATTSGLKRLVTNNFPGYTYANATVEAANINKNILVSRSHPSRAQVRHMVAATARAMGVNPRLALAHAYNESGFDATAVSPANAIGVMQVIPSSGKWAEGLVGRKLDLLNVQDNITAGVAIIRYLQANASSLDQGIAGYYQGLGGVRKYGMRPDTKVYVSKIRAAMNRF